MNKTTLTYIAVIAVLLAIIVLQRECNKPVIKQADIIVKHDTLYIPVKDTFYLDRPVPVEVIKNGVAQVVTKYDTSWQVIKEPVDSAAILADYMLTRIYKQDFTTKYGHITVSDTVEQNKLRGLGALLTLNIPQVNTSITKPVPPKNKIYIGFNLGSNGSTLGFGPNVMLQTKQDHLYGLGASYLPGTQGMYYQVHTLWKIHL